MYKVDLPVVAKNQHPTKTPRFPELIPQKTAQKLHENSEISHKSQENIAKSHENPTKPHENNHKIPEKTL